MVRKLLPVAGILGLVLLVSAPVAAYFLMQGYNEERAVAARETIVRLSMITNEVQRERAFYTAFGAATVHDGLIPRELATTDDYAALLIPQIAALTGEGGVLRRHRESLAAIGPELDELAQIRARAASGDATRLGTFYAYDDLISAIHRATIDLQEELDIPRQQQTLEAELLYLGEYLARERGYGVLAMADVVPTQELVRARQSNLAALDQLQAGIRVAHDDDRHAAMLEPFLANVSTFGRWPDDASQPLEADAAEAAHAWFRGMSSQIEGVRLLHTRLLERGGDAVG